MPLLLLLLISQDSRMFSLNLSFQVEMFRLACKIQWLLMLATFWALNQCRMSLFMAVMIFSFLVRSFCKYLFRHLLLNQQLL